MIYYVYVLKSERDGKRYIGITKNVNVRLKDHNRGKVRSTYKRQPLKLLYQEEYATTGEAKNRERYLKSGAGREWLDRTSIK